MKFHKNYINDSLWSSERGFLYDKYADGTLCDTKGIGAFWAFQTDILPKSKLNRMVAHLKDTTEFNRPHRVPSITADHKKYNPNGRYWQGGVWPGTNYMLIDGLWKNGYFDLSRQIAENHFQAVFKVWQKTGTFWEYYAPESIEPGFMARKDFIGWTGLPPIAIFIEYILGIKSDYSQNIIEWDITKCEEHGIERYPFGPDGTIDLKVRSRKNQEQKPEISIKTSIPFTLKVTYGSQNAKTEKIIKIEKNANIKL